MCQFIEQVKFARCAFIRILHRGIIQWADIFLNIFRSCGLKYRNIYIAKLRAIEQTRKLASLAIRTLTYVCTYMYTYIYNCLDQKR